MNILQRITRDIERAWEQGHVTKQIALNRDDWKELKRTQQGRWKRPGRATSFYLKGPGGLCEIFEVEDSPPYPA